MSDVIVIGASTRAAAMSALRAGWTPWCADLFADADLQRMAAVRKVAMATYPHGLLDALADAPWAPVMYTGALENWPDLIAKIDRPLWGNSPAVLRAIRSPARWTQHLRDLGVPCPFVSDRPKAEGSWLLKPRKSAGGFGIRTYTRQPFNARTHFLQERVDGTPCSAIFVGAETQSAQLVGVTRQLIGIPWLNAVGYQYCGNIGPLLLDADQEARWRCLAAGLRGFPLRGLFGVDAIVRDGVPWPVEINPRYTSSVEVLERSYRTALLPLHRAVFGPTPVPTFRLPTTPTIHGKAILFARQTLAFPADGPWLDSYDYADIPHTGEVIEQGRPVLTLFASAASMPECAAKLEETAQALDRRLWE
jgi:uncharacterized protein